MEKKYKDNHFKVKIENLYINKYISTVQNNKHRPQIQKLSSLKILVRTKELCYSSSEVSNKTKASHKN